MSLIAAPFSDGGPLPSPAVSPRGESTAPPAKPHTCRHCGAPLIDARMRESGFCCAGCSYVFRLVHEHGLAGYYRIKDEITAPADAAVFQPRDYTWLVTLQHAAEAVGRVSDPPYPAAATPVPTLTLDIQGISCAGCVWLIERIFQQQPGARDIVVNAQYGTMRLRWVRGEFSAAEFARKLQAFGYLAGPPGETVAEPESRGLIKRIGLCAAFAMNVMLFSLPTYFGMEHTYEWAGLFGVLNVVFGTLSLLVGGMYFLGRAIRALRERAMHIDLPIAVGIVGAYCGSLYGWLSGQERFVYFDFVSTFILLMLIGRWAQVAAVERNRRRLLSQQPKPQRVRISRPIGQVSDRSSESGSRTRPTAAPPATLLVTPEQLRMGDILHLNSGETLPVEARLETDTALFSLASINGEAEPRTFRAGQRVPAGALNLGREAIGLTARQAWAESLLAQLLQPTERGAARHALIEAVVRYYLIGIIGIAFASGMGWWLATQDASQTWAVVTAVLVVSCPCAIALAFPLADEMATVALRRRGVFVRRDDLWPRLSRVRKIVFDKTGTLTLENPVLQNPESLRALDGDARAALLALVRDNPHPISQCLFENLLALGPGVAPDSCREAANASHGSLACDSGDVRETIGFGLELGPWSLGRAGWRTTSADANDPLLLLRADATHGTVFARAGKVLAHFRFSDAPRPDARAELRQLARHGFATFVLSGDSQHKVNTLAEQLGVPSPHALGELTPQAKADWIAAHGSREALMLGDGANDSLAFDRALCRGTPVIHRGVLEQKADFYYLGRGIGGVRALFAVDQIRRRTQLAILIFSVAYNLLAVGLAVAGHMNPLVAAILMPINSLLTLAIVTSSMRRAFRG